MIPKKDRHCRRNGAAIIRKFNLKLLCFSFVCETVIMCKSARRPHGSTISKVRRVGKPKENRSGNHTKTSQSFVFTDTARILNVIKNRCQIDSQNDARIHIWVPGAGNCRPRSRRIKKLEPGSQKMKPGSRKMEPTNRKMVAEGQYPEHPGPFCRQGPGTSGSNILID